MTGFVQEDADRAEVAALRGHVAALEAENGLLRRQINRQALRIEVFEDAMHAIIRNSKDGYPVHLAREALEGK